MKTTPALLKERRKRRRAESQQRAQEAMIYMVRNLGLDSLPFQGEFQEKSMPSMASSTNAAISAFLRLGRRLRPMLEQAQRELASRYRDETFRRRRELKKLYKEGRLKALGRL